MTPRERGQSAKTVLKLAWDYPSYTEEVVATTGSVAKKARRALSKEDAFLYVAGNDPRPLLVLRECKTCNGTDDALLSKGGDNEKTFLLSTWFHCVKLPVDVLTPEHPFYEMFNHEDPEHLFVASRDGSQKVLLQSDTSRTELWDAMGKVLTASYAKDPQPVVRQVQKSLDRLDVLDERLLDLRSKKGELFETEGADSPKLRKINLEIDETQKEIAAILDQVAKTAKLELKAGDARQAGPGAAKAGR